MKKQFIAGIIVGSILSGAIGVFAGQYMATSNPFPVQLNGTNISLEGYNINDNTYFKLRDIADAVGGFTVGFNNNTIQLSNTVIDNEVEYYDMEKIFPNLSYYTNAKPKYYDTIIRSGVFEGEQEDIDEYTKHLMSLGFMPVIYSGYLCYAKGDYMVGFTDPIQIDGKNTFSLVCRYEKGLSEYFKH